MEKELTCSNYEFIMELSKAENHFYYENSNDQNDLFESTLSSIVSSPTTTTPSNGCGDKMMIKELIGRLGSISDHSFENNNYAHPITPINSPPLSKFNLSSLMVDKNINNNYPINNLGYFNNSDPGFVERAAKFSCFSSNNNNNNNIINNNGDSREGSSVSERNPGVELRIKSQNNSSSRKRKSISKDKVKGSNVSSIKDDNNKVEVENKESDAKKGKVDNELNKKENDGECNISKETNGTNREVLNVVETVKPEPPKDYIHVRARRGQATDSHSLAERVRREKISERMKFLQDLVPGCNKVTGKATVLDEIINYVQSLQRQVEFLSMKLSTVNSGAEFNMEALLAKDIFQSKGSSFPHTMYSLDQNSAPEFPFAYHSTQPMQLAFPNVTENPFLLNQINSTGIPRNANAPLPSVIDGFVDPLTQLPTLWEDDLQSIVQMGIVPNQTQSVPSTTLPNAHMKVEL